MNRQRKVRTYATYQRSCLFCGGPAIVRLPEGATDLDVDAEFSGQGRQFADTEDGDPIGVACNYCARQQWEKAA